MKLYRDFETQEAIDEQYNVEVSAPDFMIYADQFFGEHREQAGKSHFTAIEGFLDPASELCERVNAFVRGREQSQPGDHYSNARSVAMH